MIHFAIGTKAQFIKMAPIMHLLQEEGTPYHLLDLSQHASLTGKILNDFGLTPRITSLGKSNTSVTTYTQAATWLAKVLWQLTVHRRNLRKRLFLGQGGIVLLHGDTLSTLVGLYLAKAAGIKTALIEAGLSSGKIFDPFPEEWIRCHTGRKVDFLFPPDTTSEVWLRKRYFTRSIINTGYNTGRDSLFLIAAKHAIDTGVPRSNASKGIATIHRLETLSSKHRLGRVIRHIMNIAAQIGPITFYMHPPTVHALKRFRLMEEINSSNYVELQPLKPYPDFIRSIIEAKFILTDGGSIQEEASYINRPCLLLRNRTERREGIGANVMLTSWNIDQDTKHLLREYSNLDVPSHDIHMTASRIILNALAEFSTT